MDIISDLTRFFHPVLPANKLKKKPVRIELGGRRYVLFRDHYGQPAALNDACPHRKAPLSKGFVRPDGKLTCAYHGWHFDANGQGCSLAEPKMPHCSTVAYQVVEKYDYLWLAAKDTPNSAFPQLGGDSFEFAGSFSTFFKVPLPILLDNMSEAEHQPMIHTLFGWDEDELSQVEFKAEIFSDRTEVYNKGLLRQTPWFPVWTVVLGLRVGDYFCDQWITRFNPVHATYTISYEDSKRGQLRPVMARATMFMVPETKTSTFLHSFVFFKIARNSRLRWLRPLVSSIILHGTRIEMAADAHFIVNLADVPLELKGMHLGKFDQPIIHNRRLLESIYFNHSAFITNSQS